VITDGVIYRGYRSDGERCKGCELKARCVKGKKLKRKHLMVPVGSVLGNWSKAMAAKIDSEKGEGSIISAWPLQNRSLPTSVSIK